jgi:hypothetical protein
VRSGWNKLKLREAVALPLIAAGLLTIGCGDDGGDDGPEVDAGPVETTLFPASYLDTFVEVRDCRMSIEHAKQVRILADPAGLEPYRDREATFPEGAIVLKEEYEFGTDCDGALEGWTVMVRLAEGTGDDTLGWLWEETDAERNVLETNGPTCVDCHNICGDAPEGYEGTCAVP